MPTHTHTSSLTDDPPRLLTTAEAAGLARVSRGTILHALKTGRLRGSRIGGTGHWRLLEADLWAWALWPGASPDFTHPLPATPSDLALADRALAAEVGDSRE